MRAPAGSSGGDLDILDFTDPLRSRDNLRQASADHLALITGRDALNSALAPIFGDAELLSEDVRYTGMSLGGITGSMTFASAPGLGAAALFVGGGGYQEILSDGLLGLLLSDVLGGTPLTKLAVGGLAETFLDGADPLDRPVLFLEAIDDPLIPNASTDRWARSFGADLASPVHHPVEGLTERTLPFAGDPTRLLIHAPMAEVPIPQRHGGLIELDYAKEAVATCFRTHQEDGQCMLIDTSWSAR